MGKQNYRESVEKDHKELAETSNAMPSRRSQRKAAKQTPEKERNLLLPVLFFIFILIPVALLFYIAFLYEPNDPITSSSMETEVSFETNTTPSKSESVALADDQAQEEEREETQKLAQQEAEAKKQAKQEAEAKAKAEAEAEAKAEAEAQAKAEAEAKAKAKAEAEAQAKAEAEALAKKQREKEAAEKQQQKKSETAQPSGKTHVVQPGETLYRIAVNNYGAAGAASGVDKIKQANGLSSNEISPGQTLVLP